MSKVYQCQKRVKGRVIWMPVSTKSGGSFCNTLAGAKSKLSRIDKEWYDARIVSWELGDHEVEVGDE